MLTKSKGNLTRSVFRWLCAGMVTGFLLTCAALKSLESPLVIDSYPAERTGFTDVRPNIYLKFDKEMNHELTQNAFSLTSDSPIPKGAFVWSGNTMYYQLEGDLEYGGRYTVKLLPSAQAKDESKYLTTFLAHFYAGTDLTPPRVVTTNPIDLNMSVALNTPIDITFSRPMSITETEAAFQLSPSVTGLFTWSVGNTVLTYTPFQGLTFNQQYAVTIAKTAKDARGMPMVSDHVFRFKAGTDFVKPQVLTVQTTGGTAIFPGPAATTVEKNEGFVVTFDEAMDYSPSQSSFSIVDGHFGNTIAGSFSWLGSFAGFTFQPTGLLTPGREYYLTVTENAKDAFGNPLLSQVATSFVVNGPNSQYVTIASVVQGAGCPSPGTAITNTVLIPIFTLSYGAVVPPWNCIVVITFSAPMLVESVPDNISITRLLGNDSALVGTMTQFSWNVPRTVLSLSLGQLGNNVYLLKIIGTNTGVKDGSNNYLQSDYSLFFRSNP